MKESDDINKHGLQIALDRGSQTSGGDRWRRLAFGIFTSCGIASSLIAGNAVLLAILVVVLFITVIAELKPAAFRLPFGQCVKNGVSPERHSNGFIYSGKPNRSVESIAEQDHRVTEFVNLMEERNRIPNRQLH